MARGIDGGGSIAPWNQPNPIKNQRGKEFLAVPRGEFPLGGDEADVRAAGPSAERGHHSPAGIDDFLQPAIDGQEMFRRGIIPPHRHHPFRADRDDHLPTRGKVQG